MPASIVTDAGRAAATAAQINGIEIAIAEIALGTAQYAPTASATALTAEVVRFPILQSIDSGEGSVTVSGLLKDPIDEPTEFTTDTLQLVPAGVGAEVREVVVKSADRLTTYTEGVDYTVNEAAGTLTRIDGGAIAAGATVARSFRRYFAINEIGCFLSDGTLFSVVSSALDTIAFKSALVPGIPIDVILELIGLPIENITVVTSSETLDLFNADLWLSNLTLHFKHAANHARIISRLHHENIYLKA
jgi:hypothetical protein